MSEEATNLADAPEVDNLPVDDAAADTATLDDYGNPVEDTPEPEDDSEEIEYDGNKYRIPKALKDGFLMQSDYTRKTQALAQERDAFAAERTQFGNLSNAEINARASVIAIDQSIEEFKRIDWQAWSRTDPAAAQAARFEYEELKERRQQAVNAYGQAQQQRQVQEQQETVRRLQQGAAELARDIPGWNQEKATALLDFGVKQFGFSRDEMAAIDDPRAIKVLNAAFEFVQSSAKQQATAKAQAQQAVKPAAKVGGSSPATGKLDDRTSTDAWMKARNAQLAKKR